MSKKYQIIRRAFSKETVVEIVELNWVDACLYAMKLQVENKDGEYFERDCNTKEPVINNYQCPVQLAFAFL